MSQKVKSTVLGIIFMKVIRVGGIGKFDINANNVKYENESCSIWCSLLQFSNIVKCGSVKIPKFLPHCVVWSIVRVKSCCYVMPKHTLRPLLY